MPSAASSAAGGVVFAADGGASAARRRLRMVRAHPLVGNAIRHGLSPKIGPGRLSIEVSSQGPLLILAVEDDGRGATLPLATGLGVGNTRERLHALYSDRAALSIDTAPDAVSAEPVSNSPWEDHIDA